MSPVEENVINVLQDILNSYKDSRESGDGLENYWNEKFTICYAFARAVTEREISVKRWVVSYKN